MYAYTYLIYCHSFFYNTTIQTRFLGRYRYENYVLTRYFLNLSELLICYLSVPRFPIDNLIITKIYSTEY